MLIVYIKKRKSGVYINFVKKVEKNTFLVKFRNKNENASIEKNLDITASDLNTALFSAFYNVQCVFAELIEMEKEQ
jgi:hypothetical protein